MEENNTEKDYVFTFTGSLMFYVSDYLAKNARDRTDI